MATLKRLLPAGLLVLLVAACAHTPPQYESHYTPSPTAAATTILTTPQAAPEAPQASFFDNFNRPDTRFGLGEGWELRGAYEALSDSMPPATDGFIRNDAYTYAGASEVWAVRRFDGTVRRVGALGRFRQIGAGENTTFGIGISSNDKVSTDQIMLSANLTGWELRTSRANSAHQRIMGGRFAPALLPGVNYQFELEAAGSTVVVHVPGEKVVGTADVSDLIGNHAFWLEYLHKPPAGTAFDFDTVWAAEDGKILTPIETPKHN